MFELIPIEFNLRGVYMPPLLIAGVFGLLTAVQTSSLLNRYGLARHFFYPPLAFVALTVIFTLLIETIMAAV